MSNNSSSTSNLGNVLQARNTSLGLNLPNMQSITVPTNLKSEVVIIPSTSQPNLACPLAHSVSFVFSLPLLSYSQSGIFQKSSSYALQTVLRYVSSRLQSIL